MKIEALVQLDLFSDPPPTRAELAADGASLQALYDAFAEAYRLPAARVELSSRRGFGDDARDDTEIAWVGLLEEVGAEPVLRVEQLARVG